MDDDFDWFDRTADMSLEELWEAFYAANPMIYGTPETPSTKDPDEAL